MANAGNVKSRALRVLRRIRSAIANGLVSEAPDGLVAPVLDGAFVLMKSPVVSGQAVDRVEAAIVQLERWGESRTAPTYRRNAYARSWIRIIDSQRC